MDVKRTRARAGLPLVVKRSLAKLGADLSAARRRRRIPIATIAERALVSRQTITRVERGDAGVSLGIYATVLYVLGLGDRIDKLADPATDPLGIALETEHLPERIRRPRET